VAPSLQYVLASTDAELEQILQLQFANLPQNLDHQQIREQGFVTVKHSLPLLQRMNGAAGQVIAKHGNKVVGYALVMLKEFREMIPVLMPMFDMIGSLSLEGKPLSEERYYVMGQICVHQDYRGQGVFDGMYAKHRAAYSSMFDILITEVSSRNTRSMRAHERVGFKTIHTFQDDTDEWNIVLWDWR
jgi:ribosomal protein S18 acetylase RimI-like enzyme